MSDSELENRAATIRQRLTQLRDSLDFDQKLLRIAEIEDQMAAADFWNNQDRAQLIVADLKGLRAVAVPLKESLAAADDLQGLLEILDEDESARDEVVAEVERLEELVESLELKALLDGPHDDCGALLSVHARDGGVDANDWAAMLLQMYIAWAGQHDYTVELIDRQDNEEAGITQATIAVRGPMAYGFLKGEEGMHRLVRISPFNSEGKRQTSFAAVDVAPEINDSVEVDIDEKDVREDTYRASGAGGQHVNKTDSAVRLTHLPSGVVTQCQSERSQHKNRANAWKMLRARLARIEEERREEEQLAKYKNKVRQKGFGSQIRNYFLHPDQRVKDARTEHLQNSFHSVMAGDIQGFLDAFLRWRMVQNSAD
ncbi:MAG: peptide chain release factor 2 [Planctomycetales bacterium]|nr:peptide chain release factor 2 [Planctomycetales bacterium]